MVIKIITMSCTDESIMFESGPKGDVRDVMVPCLHQRKGREQSPPRRLTGG